MSVRLKARTASRSHCRRLTPGAPRAPRFDCELARCRRCQARSLHPLGRWLEPATRAVRHVSGAVPLPPARAVRLRARASRTQAAEARHPPARVLRIESLPATRVDGCAQLTGEPGRLRTRVLQRADSMPRRCRTPGAASLRKQGIALPQAMNRRQLTGHHSMAGVLEFAPPP